MPIVKCQYIINIYSLLIMIWWYFLNNILIFNNKFNINDIIHDHII